MTAFSPDREVRDSKDFELVEPPQPYDPTELSLELLIANNSAGEGFSKIVLGCLAHLDTYGIRLFCIRI